MCTNLWTFSCFLVRIGTSTWRRCWASPSALYCCYGIECEPSTHPVSVIISRVWIWTFSLGRCNTSQFVIYTLCIGNSFTLRCVSLSCKGMWIVSDIWNSAQHLTLKALLRLLCTHWCNCNTEQSRSCWWVLQVNYTSKWFYAAHAWSHFRRLFSLWRPIFAIQTQWFSSYCCRCVNWIFLIDKNSKFANQHQKIHLTHLQQYDENHCVYPAKIGRHSENIRQKHGHACAA